MTEQDPAAEQDDAVADGTGMPRWVKVTGLVVVLLAVAFVVSSLAGVDHGPGQHGSGAAPAAGTPQGHTMPAGGHSP